MARYDGHIATPDYSEALYLDIGKIVDDGVYLSAPRLFEDIISYCEKNPLDANTQDLSDSIGIKRIAPLTIEAIIESFYKPAGLLWRRGHHFAIVSGKRGTDAVA